MKHGIARAGRLCLWTGATALALLPAAITVAGEISDTGAAEPALSLFLEEASSMGPGDGTRSPAAANAMEYGPLPAGRADIQAKATANATADAVAAARVATPIEPTAADLALFGSPGTGRGEPSIVGKRSFQGQFDAKVAPSDSTGAIGTTRYVQMVNRRFAIYNRTSNIPLSQGTLAALAGRPASDSLFDPQIIWDPTTNRFYYVMDDIVSATAHQLAYGFSKTSSPNTAADWCKYTTNYGSLFPDFPKLGDTQHFSVIGVNVYNTADDFQRADVLAIRKPGVAPITTCPSASSLPIVVRSNIKDSSGKQVFSPTPANQIDTAPDGYIVARNLALPSNRLWIFKVTRNAATGAAVVDAVGKSLTLPFTNSIPPDATQGGATQKLDTSDTRPTQAVLAINPRRGANTFSLWTQQTVANSSGTSAIRAYEINPVTPSLVRSGTISTPLGFVYNAAISSDRRVDGAIKAFGSSVMITASASSSLLNIPPGIAMGSSVDGSLSPSAVLVKAAIGPYRDFTCKTAGSTCRWGDYSSAAPDPRPAIAGTGVVWFTNQYSGVANALTTQSNWRTWIWAAKP